MTKPFPAKFPGTCQSCRKPFAAFDMICGTPGNRYTKRRWYHAGCAGGVVETPEPSPEPTPSPDAPTPEPNPDLPMPDEDITPEPKTSGIGSDLGRVLAEAVEPYITAKVDRAEVRDMVDAAVAKALEAQPGCIIRTVEIKTAEGTRTIEGTHLDFEKVLGLVQAGRSVGFSVYIYGPPGSGKSTIAKQVATALDLPFYLLSLAPMSPPSALTGYGTADGRLVESDAYRAYTSGGLLAVEEIDNANDGVLTSFNAALANGHGSWPVVGTTPKHENFVLMALANTPALGPTRSFPCRRRLDAAFRDRFVFVEVDYDLELETRLAREVNPSCSSWIATARKLREWCQSNAPEVFVTPRSVVFGAALLVTGMSTREAAHSAIFRGAEADIANRAFQAVGV